MRILCIGLDGRVAEPGGAGFAAVWTREVSRHVAEYIVLAEGRHKGPPVPVNIGAHATAYLVPANPVSYPFAAAAFAERLHARQPFDLVTTEDPIRAGLAGALFSRRTGVPLNVENHSLHINEPVWLNARAHHRVYNRIAIWVARRADSIRNYSPDQIAPLVRLGIDPSRLYCIPAPCPQLPEVDRESARRALGVPAGDEIVLTVGRLIPYKNIGALIESMAIVRRSRPARLLVAGEGSSRAPWEARAAELGVAESVTWLGNVPEATMGQLYAAADAFVAPAVHETGPRTVMEAYLAGCPVIATPNMGMVHFGICEHGETGYYVKPNDSQGMAATILSVLSNPQRARAMAALGRARALDRCSIGRIARDVASVFRETARRAALEQDLRAREPALEPADG